MLEVEKMKETYEMLEGSYLSSVCEEKTQTQEDTDTFPTFTQDYY